MVTLADMDARAAQWARQGRALDIWRTSLEDIEGTPAEVYLRSRGLDPTRLSSLHGPGRWPATLRYSKRANLDPDRLCRAMVVAVHDASSGLVTAIQRILLRADGEPVRKDNGKKVKVSLGPISGSSARFDYWPDPQGRWGLAEGPETALAAYALTGIPTWAAIGTDNMKSKITPPPWARHAFVFADNDRPGLTAAGEVAHRLRAYPGIETVRVVGAAAAGTDAADLLGAAYV